MIEDPEVEELLRMAETAASDDTRALSRLVRKAKRWQKKIAEESDGELVQRLRPDAAEVHRRVGPILKRLRDSMMETKQGRKLLAKAKMLEMLET